MKTTKKILSLLIAVFMLAGMLVSCGEDKGELIATYGDNSIYENDTDYSDFFMMNSYYYFSSTGNSSLSGDDYTKIIEESVKNTIIWREMNAQFEKLGYTVDEEAVKDAALEDAQYFDDFYTGGYAAFVETWNLSEDAFTMFNKYEAMLDVAAVKIMNVTEPTEEEVYDYYVANSADYVIAPHYSINTIVVQATNDVPTSEALADAKSYIAMLQSGKSWEEVKTASAIKYNAENGMIYSQFLSGEEKVILSTFEPVSDLDAALAKIDADFKAENGVSFDEMFPEGFKAYANANGLTEGSDAYNKANELFYNYSAKVYNTEYAYIITTAWEDGKTYAEPLYHAGLDCYAVITFNYLKDKAAFESFDDVKDEISAKIFESEKETAKNNYISQTYIQAIYPNAD